MNSITLTREAVGHYSYTDHGLNYHLYYQHETRTWHLYNGDRFELEVQGLGVARDYIERQVNQQQQKEGCGCRQNLPACAHGRYLYEKWQAADQVASCPGLGKLRDFARLAVLDEEQHWLDLWRAHYQSLQAGRTSK